MMLIHRFSVLHIYPQCATPARCLTVHHGARLYIFTAITYLLTADTHAMHIQFTYDESILLSCPAIFTTM